MAALSTHIKHLLIAAGILVVIYWGAQRYAGMREKLAQIEADAKSKISADQKTVQAANQTVQNADNSNAKIDAATQAKLDIIQAKLASKPDSDQIQAMIKSAVPGLVGLQAGKDAQGNAILSVPDTQANRDAINKTDAAIQTCNFSLDGCQQKQANLQAAIDALKQANAAKDDTITTQQKEIKKLTTFGKGGNFWARTGRVIIPVGCAAAGGYLGASRGNKAAAIGALAGGGVCGFVVRF